MNNINNKYKNIYIKKVMLVTEFSIIIYLIFQKRLPLPLN